MATILFYGDLQRFGKRFSLAVNTAGEAIRALIVQLPSLRKQLQQGHYQLRISGRDATVDNLHQRINEPLANGAIIHLVPRITGAKSGFFNVILGAALVGLSFLSPITAVASGSLASGLFAAGIGMAIGGVASMLTPIPKGGDLNSADNGKANSYFSNLDNAVAQGNPVPLVYGEILVGSRVISQEISVWDE